MDYLVLKEEIAKQKLELNETTGTISYFKTIWNGNLVIITFNHISGEIVNLYYPGILEPSDIDCLKRVILNWVWSNMQDVE
jgi:hypothetical protein